MKGGPSCVQLASLSNGLVQGDPQGAASGALNLPARSRTTVAVQSTSWTATIAAWQEPDLFTTNIRAAFGSLS